MTIKNIVTDYSNILGLVNFSKLGSKNNKASEVKKTADKIDSDGKVTEDELIEINAASWNDKKSGQIELTNDNGYKMTETRKNWQTKKRVVTDKDNKLVSYEDHFDINTYEYNDDGTIKSIIQKQKKKTLYGVPVYKDGELQGINWYKDPEHKEFRCSHIFYQENGVFKKKTSMGFLNPSGSVEAVNKEIKSNTNAENPVANATDIPTTTNLKASSTNTSKYAGYNAERGNALVNAANSLYGNVSKPGNYCGRGVYQAIKKAFGYTAIADGCRFGNELAKRDDWIEITSQVSPDDLDNLPAGAIISWSGYKGSTMGAKYGHVCIVDGQGNEISDHKKPLNKKYIDRGSTYRVFIPK